MVFMAFELSDWKENGEGRGFFFFFKVFDIKYIYGTISLIML